MVTWRQKWKTVRETYFSNIWDTLAWVAFGYVVIYALLKVVGVLHSPVQVDIGLIVSAAYFIGKHAQKIDTCIKDIEKHDNRLARIETTLAAH